MNLHICKLHPDAITPTYGSEGAADLLTLIEAYAEARHCQGHSSYNTQTAAARKAVKDALAQRFDAADMATASAQGFRDGVASITVQAADSVLEDAARWNAWSQAMIVVVNSCTEPEFLRVMSDAIGDAELPITLQQLNAWVDAARGAAKAQAAKQQEATDV